MKKGLLLFVLLPIVMFFSGCTGGDSAGNSIFGTWYIDSMTVTMGTFTDCFFTFNEDGSYSTSYQAGGGPHTQSGTVSPTDMPADTPITGTVVTSSGPPYDYVPPPGETFQLRYSDLTATTVGIEIKSGGSPDFEGPFTFTRQ